MLVRSGRIWARDAVRFTIVSALPFLPVLALHKLLPEPRRYCGTAWDILLPYGMDILSCLLWLATPAAVIDGVERSLRGERVSIAGCFRRYVTGILAVLGLGLMIGLVGMALALVVAMAAEVAKADMQSESTSALAFVVAGALNACLFWVAVPAAATERAGVFGALRRSALLTGGVRGPILVIALVTLFTQAIPLYAHGPIRAAAGEWVWFLAVIVFGTPGAVACSVGYHELRAAREGAATDVVRVFA